jgi:hypothetical protein
VSGTYDSVTGALMAVFTLNSGETMTFDATGILFAATTTLLNDVTAQVELFGTPAFGNTDYPPGEYAVLFENRRYTPANPGDQKSNTLWTYNDGRLIMALWGAGPNMNGSLPSKLLGLDLRLELTPVPIPAAILLFGSGLMALLGIRRRRQRI